MKRFTFFSVHKAKNSFAKQENSYLKTAKNLETKKAIFVLSSDWRRAEKKLFQHFKYA